MGFKKLPNGEYYYFNRDSNTELLVKKYSARNTKSGYVAGNILVPPELVGKKVRLKLEIINTKKSVER